MNKETKYLCVTKNLQKVCGKFKEVTDRQKLSEQIYVTNHDRRLLIACLCFQESFHWFFFCFVLQNAAMAKSPWHPELPNTYIIWQNEVSNIPQCICTLGNAKSSSCIMYLKRNLTACHKEKMCKVTLKPTYTGASVKDSRSKCPQKHDTFIVAITVSAVELVNTNSYVGTPSATTKRAMAHAAAETVDMVVQT